MAATAVNIEKASRLYVKRLLKEYEYFKTIITRIKTFGLYDVLYGY